jgi:hypothetical protein
MTLTGRPRLSAGEEGMRDPGYWAARGGKEHMLAGPRRPAGLGRAGCRKGRERPSWARPRGRKRKEEKEDGPAKKEKKREREKKCIQMYLNLNLKFKFKWKTNNETIQCGMKCTRSIFPYISFYG